MLSFSNKTVERKKCYDSKHVINSEKVDFCLEIKQIKGIDGVSDVVEPALSVNKVKLLVWVLMQF